MGKLFKDLEEEPTVSAKKPAAGKESASLDSIKELQGKLTLVIDKVKSLKNEKSRLEARVVELESALAERDEELKAFSSDKLNIKDQITDLLNELESIETG